MADAVDICNGALIQIGATRINSLGDNSDAARACNTLYESTRDELLRLHPWNFAIKRIALAELTTPPVFEFDHQYGLPSDCVRVLMVSDSDYYYSIEGRTLLTDASAVSIKYVSRIVDVNQFDTLFRKALEVLLASRLAISLTNDASKSQQKMNEFRLLMIDARVSDAQEGNADEIIDDDLVAARQGKKLDAPWYKTWTGD